LITLEFAIAASCQNVIPLFQPIPIVPKIADQPPMFTCSPELTNYSPFNIDYLFVGNTMTYNSIVGKLSGIITRLSDSTPVENAIITIINDQGQTFITGSDTNGLYSCDSIESGIYLLTVNKEGFNPVADSITIAGNDTLIRDFALTAPTMVINPLEITEIVQIEEFFTRVITVQNTGDGALNWNASIIGPGKDKITIPKGDGNFPCGAAAPSIGRAPLTSHVAGTREIQLKGRSLGYAFEIPGNTFFSFNTDDPSTQNFINTIDYSPSGGTFDAVNTGFMYIIDCNENLFMRVSTCTGDVTIIGSCNPYYGQTWTGITVDKATNKMYGISSDLSESYIYTINMETGEATVIAATGIPGAIDVAIDENGQMYSFDIVNDEAYKIDKDTGASTLLGSIGFDANYAQGMGWDPEQDIVYLAAYNNDGSGGELRILDRVTGNTNLIGGFPDGEQIDALAFSGTGLAWLSMNPYHGVIPAGNSQNIAIYLNATILEHGTYTKSITFNSEPNVGTDTVPVTFTVFPEDGPTLTISEVYSHTPLASITVHASNITNMGSFQFTIDYDPTKAIFSGISDWYPGITDVTIGNPSAGKLTFVWAASTGGITINDGDFFTLHLTATDFPPWDYCDICWSDNPTPREFADWNGNIFTPFYDDGFIYWFVGVPEDKLQPIHIYPNPASDDVQLKVTTPSGTLKYCHSPVKPFTMKIHAMSVKLS